MSLMLFQSILFRCCVECPLWWFLLFSLGLWVLGKIITKVKCSSHHHVRKSMMSTWLLTGPVDLDHYESEVAQSCPTLSDPMDCRLPGSSVHGIFQARVLEWGAIAFSRGSSRPRDRTRVSCIVGRRFTIWALLQGIFPTQGWNLGLLHCRQILYCLSHQGSSLIFFCLLLSALSVYSESGMLKFPNYDWELSISFL